MFGAALLVSPITTSSILPFTSQSWTIGDALTGVTFTRATPASYISGGFVLSASVNVARDAHVVQGTRSLLLEEDVINTTNGATDTTGWFRQKVNESVGALTDPQGIASNASIFIEQANAGTHALLTGITEDETPLNDNAIVSLSSLFNAQGRTTGSIRHNNKSSSEERGINQNLSDTTQFGLLTGNELDHSVERLSNGWLWVHVISPVGAGPDSTTLHVSPIPPFTSDDTYTGDGTSGMGMWGPQGIVSRRQQSVVFKPTKELPASRSADLIAWPMNSTATHALTASVSFFERGASRDSVTSGIFYVGPADASGARFWIENSGSGYRVVHDNGSTQVSSAVTVPTFLGQKVDVVGFLNADGSVKISVTVTGSTTVGSVSAANTRADSWASGSHIWVNSVGSGSVGNGAYLAWSIAP